MKFVKCVFVILLLVPLLGCTAGAMAPTATVAPTDTVAPSATHNPTLQPEDLKYTITAGGEERFYLLHIPPGLDELQPLPVVFAFHGWGDTPSDLQGYIGLDEIANEKGFITVYPDGVEHSWNAGGCCGAAQARAVNDIDFTRQIIADLSARLNIDKQRIYALGISNGAGFVYRLACEMSDTFAAIAPVAGAQIFDPCRPQRPVSIVHMHGLKDDAAPYAGGGEYKILPIEQLIYNWGVLDGCVDAPLVDASMKFVRHIIYSNCTDDTAVELYAIEIGYHSWPSDAVMPASTIIWDFFAAHPKK